VYAIVRVCAHEDNGEAAGAREQIVKAESTYVRGDKGKAARDRKRECKAASVCESNAKVVHAREGNSEVVNVLCVCGGKTPNPRKGMMRLFD
jgi:hypothetical protein